VKVEFESGPLAGLLEASAAVQVVNRHTSPKRQRGD
jgi:hypothetical protein